MPVNYAAALVTRKAQCPLLNILRSARHVLLPLALLLLLLLLLNFCLSPNVQPKRRPVPALKQTPRSMDCGGMTPLWLHAEYRAIRLGLFGDQLRMPWF
jgi:hypothetical protein